MQERIPKEIAADNRAIQIHAQHGRRFSAIWVPADPMKTMVAKERAKQGKNWDT